MASLVEKVSICRYLSMRATTDLYDSTQAKALLPLSGFASHSAKFFFIESFCCSIIEVVSQEALERIPASSALRLCAISTGCHCQRPQCFFRNFPSTFSGGYWNRPGPLAHLPNITKSLAPPNLTFKQGKWGAASGLGGAGGHVVIKFSARSWASGDSWQDLPGPFSSNLLSFLTYTSALALEQDVFWMRRSACA